MSTSQPSLPAAFVQRMRTLLGTEAEPFFAAYAASPRVGLRANVLKLEPPVLQRMVPFGLEPVPWCPSGFFVAEDARPGKHPFHAAGLYYIQEPSAMAVAEVLDVRPGHRVLDLAAAPGGKSTHIAGLLQGEGLLVANEVESSRVKALGENLERWGARNVVLVNETPERLAAALGAAFDRVLLDAPCSGEGMFRKNAAARAEWSVEHVQGCAIRQERILEHAARLVASDGLLAYSTCTFAPEENEQGIAAFLARHPGWELASIPAQPGFEHGRPDWSDPPLPELRHAARLWPHRLPGEGHFIALLRNQSTTSESTLASGPRGPSKAERRRSVPGSTAPTAAHQSWQAFEQASLAIHFPAERILAVNDQVYLVPDAAPDLGGLRIVRPGLWLGTSKPGRFEPSHALALALGPGAARLQLAVSGAECERYLAGETLASAGPAGWVLVTLDGWALGWGRRVGGVVKNFYPKGLRWSR